MDHGEQDSRGRLRFCSLLEFHLRGILSSCLFFYVCGLFKMVFDCLWVVVEFFEVVVNGCRSFLLFTQNEVNNCGKVTWTGGWGICSRFTQKF